MLECKHSLLTAEVQISDLTSEMDDLLGLPAGVELDLADVAPVAAPLESRDFYVEEALSRNPELEAASNAVEKGPGRRFARPTVSTFRM